MNAYFVLVSFLLMMYTAGIAFYVAKPQPSSAPGAYEYMCMACGLGMGVTGYMDGYITVTS